MIEDSQNKEDAGAEGLVVVICCIIAICGLGLGIFWAGSYAWGEWMGEMGRWEYLRANWALCLKGVAALIVAVISAHAVLFICCTNAKPSNTSPKNDHE